MEKHNEPSHRLAKVVDVKRMPPVRVLSLVMYVSHEQIERLPRIKNVVAWLDFERTTNIWQLEQPSDCTSQHRSN